MKRQILIAITLLLFFLVASCTSGNQILITAETIMDEHPDSALHILKSIPYPQKLSRQEQANYCLQMTRALDKNYLPIDDLLLEAAVEYYAKSNNNEKKGMAYFYQGLSFFEKNQISQAATCYKIAEECLRNVENNQLKALLYNNMGFLNRRQNLHDTALPYFRKALNYAQMAGNNSGAVINLHEIARYHQFKNNPDSANHYYRKSLEYVEVLPTNDKAFVYHNIGANYYVHNNLDSALVYLLKSATYETVKKEQCRTYGVLAEIYYIKGDKQQAAAYWDKALETEDLSVHGFIYKALLDRSIDEKNYEKVVEYAEKYIQSKDKIYMNIVTSEVSDIQQKYDTEALARKHLEFRLRNTRLIIALLVFFSVCMALFILQFILRKSIRNRSRAELGTKEMELENYKIRFSELGNKISSGMYEKHGLVAEREKLFRKIEAHEADIQNFKRLNKDDNLIAEKLMAYESAFRGMKLYMHLKSAEGKIPVLSNKDFTDLIRFYRIYDDKFIDVLMDNEYHLTTLERTVCILFRIGLSHKQVSDCLGNSSATLARCKTRIKKAKFNLTDDRKLEDYILSL